MNQKEVWQPDFHQINPDFPSIYFHGTRDEVMRLIGRRSPQAREIESRIQMLERRTLWRAEIGERVVEIKERFGVLRLRDLLKILRVFLKIRVSISKLI